jgi:SAM-dependent methyltransferase
MHLFFELHQGLPREGPGDAESTRRALAMLPDLPAQARILDVACGPGAQTLVLAESGAGMITAVDTHRPFLRHLQDEITAHRLTGRVHILQMSMFDLGLAPGSFNLIWSEGAIYIMGFGEGLRAWKPLLRPGGYVAVTEISWLKPDPPAEVRAFWEADYPGIGTIPVNLARAEAAGYQAIGHFTLPETAWWQDYYTPLEQRARILRQKYASDPAAQSLLDLNQREIDLYRRYSEWYGYEFYLFKISLG